MTLGILYHMPFWQAADGSLWEAEGSFARYVDSLAPYFDEIVLSVPVFDTPQASGSRVRAANVTLAPLPYFPGPAAVLSDAAVDARRGCAPWVEQCDVIHLRVPDAGGDLRVSHRPGPAQAGVPARRRRLPGAAAAPAVSRRQEGAVRRATSRSRSGRSAT